MRRGGVSPYRCVRNECGEKRLRETALAAYAVQHHAFAVNGDAA